MKRTWMVVCASALGIFLLFGVLSQSSAESKNGFKKELGLLSFVVALIQNGYVQEVPSERLFQGAMNGLLKTLDPYSQYLDAKAYQELKADTQGRFAGAGMEVSVKGGILHVIAPLDGSPAASAGIRPGDVITKIDGVVTKDMTLLDAVRKLRGESGSVVALTLLREDTDAPFEVAVRREEIQAKGIRESKLLEGGVGYVRIADFQRQTAGDLKEALKNLNARGLVLDLRSNPGGLLDSAVESAELFIPAGQILLSTRGKDRAKIRTFVSKNPLALRPGPIAVLVNKGSASGSEILAGALQDHGLARVFGKKTYGKGCVQTLTPLSDGSAVRITTSYYYTPKGRLIHEIGISPDEEVNEDPKSGEDLALAAALKWIHESQA